jgi:UDP-glucuronate 4-epimerase
MQAMKILVTGAAGFIGSALSLKLLERGDRVIGLDNLNDYYDVSLKQARLDRTLQHPGFTDVRIDLEDREAIAETFKTHRPDAVVNLAAQAGVRYSSENPYAYVNTNLVGFLNILEGCRHYPVKHLVYASSSSIYGANTNMPFSEHNVASHPVSLYGATKRANELMAHSYSHFYRIPTTGLRFFTVYGPWGRPDMALFLFTRNILAGEPIDVFNHGHHRRDFTYIDDIVEGVIRTLDSPAAPNPGWSGDSPDPATSLAPYRVFNIGNNRPVNLMHYIEVLEQQLGRKAEKNMLPMQNGDVPETYASTDELKATVGYRPATTVEDGIRRFVEWYRKFYDV